MSIEKEELRIKTFNFVRDTLSKHPEFAGTINKAMTTGIIEAEERQRNLNHDMETAVVLISLMTKEKLGDEKLSKLAELMGSFQFYANNMETFSDLVGLNKTIHRNKGKKNEG